VAAAPAGPTTSGSVLLARTTAGVPLASASSGHLDPVRPQIARHRTKPPGEDPLTKH
jgi:hypothetical protein